MKTDIYNTNKKYSIIYADPPWSYNDKGCNGAAEKNYSTMKLDEICNLPVNQITEKNCYKSIGFQWIKLNKNGIGCYFGLGRWTRGNTEPCLIAVKGKPKRISASISQLIFAPFTKHSEKPFVVRDKIIELIGDLPRIELFARQQVDGWDCWGNEV